MNVRLPVSLALAMALSGSALGQSGVMVTSVQSATKPPVNEFGLVPYVPPKIPEGVFGLYDPKTRTFTPAPPHSSSSPAAGSSDSGSIMVNIHVSIGDGIGPHDTVFCDATVEFFNSFSDAFSNNHYETPPEINFEAGYSNPDISTAFSFSHVDPNQDPRYIIDLQCRIPNASDGTYHKAEVVTEEQDLKSGSNMADIDISF